MEFVKFNAFDYFDTDAEALEYLAECFNDEDPRLFTIALTHFIEKKGVVEVARLTGLNRQSLYKTVKGETKPSFNTVHKIMHTFKINANFVSA